MKVFDSARKFLGNMLVAKSGPLTRKLERTRGVAGLGQVPAHLAPDHTLDSVCGFCATGCGLRIHMRGGQAVNLTPDPLYHVNTGNACPKGWEALAPLEALDRGTTPLFREPGTNATLAPVDWDTATHAFTENFRAIIAKHGTGSVAFLSTGQIPTEEMAILGSFFKFAMGGLHGDGNTRQCMATAATAYKQSFGFDSPPFTYEDLEETDLAILVGSNLCAAHPIMWDRLMRNKRKPNIVVVDPRSTETAQAATHHFAVAPKGDLAFLQCLAYRLLQAGCVDESFVTAHTNGFEEFRNYLLGFFDFEANLARCGIPVAQLDWLAERIASGARTSFWWTMGVNQSHEGVRTAQAMIDICLMTGNIGKPGTGPNSITGQCNAMGSRIFSNTTSLLGGHDFLNPTHRSKVAGILGIPQEAIPASNSLAYDQIIDGVRKGDIKGLWLIATNTAHSWMDQNELDSVLAKLDFLVVQDMYHSTHSARKAHLFLPAAGWGEKEGFLINSERRLGPIKRVHRPPGEALSDFHIIKLLAEAWGGPCAPLFDRWTSPADTFADLRRISAGQPCDITGIQGYEDLTANGGIQWPHPEGSPAPAAHRRLFADGRFFHPDGKARFVFEASRAPLEIPDAAYPFVLLTGRGSSSQWHTLTRSGKSAVLSKISPSEILLEIHPDDAQELGVEAGAFVKVSTRRGSIRIRTHITPQVGRGNLFLPMHFAETNRLTLNSVDPHSRQPSYKHCAATVERFLS